MAHVHLLAAHARAKDPRTLEARASTPPAPFHLATKATRLIVLAARRPRPVEHGEAALPLALSRIPGSYRHLPLP